MRYKIRNGTVSGTGCERTGSPFIVVNTVDIDLSAEFGSVESAEAEEMVFQGDEGGSAARERWRGG